MKYGCAHLDHQPKRRHAFEGVVAGRLRKDFHRPAYRAATRRAVFTRCVKTLKRRDTLTAWGLDRLARSLRDLIAILEDFDDPRREKLSAEGTFCVPGHRQTASAIRV
ncbi:MAG: recombinase family protein [Deltaproteobacteria bacterium]|nr:recombinase family protein [Deltaproteobacteria bacterium]